MIDVQFRPTDDLELDFNAFKSQAGGDQLQPQLDVLGQPRHRRRQPHPDLVHACSNGTLVAATCPTRHAGQQRAVRDRRRDLPSRARSRRPSFVQPRREVARRATGSTLHGKVGTDRRQGRDAQAGTCSRATCSTPARSYTHATASARRRTSRSRAATRRRSPARRSTGSSARARPRPRTRRSTAQVDGEWRFDSGMFTNIKFGVPLGRAQARARTRSRRARTAPTDPFNPANLPALERRDLSGRLRRPPRRQLPAQRLAARPGELERWGDIYSNRDPLDAPLLARRVRARRRR